VQQTPVEAEAAWKQGMSIATKLTAEEMAQVKTLLADTHRRQGLQRLQEDKK
jgi:hypothetical protein